MTTFRYQAVETNGTVGNGGSEAEDRKTALWKLGERGLFPSRLEVNDSNAAANTVSLSLPNFPSGGGFLGGRVRRKEITAFTREMGSVRHLHHLGGRP